MYFRVQLALREGEIDLGRVYDAKNITRRDWTLGGTLAFADHEFLLLLQHVHVQA